ncbi:hypothetical protein [Oceaniglobus trochenteri]|uniref:hypothetical protein n=1 Tax=Oceaniglobus trochenteri TaxID=2763260 RepID=UPI001CFFDBB8|nr:hypothetical protein [Oceaniglobus trochenteri]
MAIADLVQYEREFPLKLKRPDTRKEIGVTFMVRHIDCQAATEVGDRGRATAVLGESGGSTAWDRQLETIAACVCGWDWGDQEFEEGKGAPEYSPEAVLRVLRHPSAKWIVVQVVEATGKIGNFTNN